MSKLLNWFGVFAALLTCTIVTLKFRYDIIKKAADKRNVKERLILDEDLKNKTAEALRATAALNERQKPRAINQEQRHDILATLARFPPIPILVSYTTNDPEAAAFGRGIADIITEAGYTLTIESPNVTNGAVPGLTFAVRDSQNTPLVAPALQATLKTSGITASWVAWLEVPVGSIWIKVGTKPLQP